MGFSKGEIGSWEAPKYSSELNSEVGGRWRRGKCDNDVALGFFMGFFFGFLGFFYLNGFEEFIFQWFLK